MYNIVTVTFKDSNTATANGVRQFDYGQILRIQGLQLPTAVEVHFALIDSKDSVTRIGTTKDGVTDVVIPDSMIEAGKNIFAYVYLRDSESGQTEYEIKIVVTTRAKPEAFDTPEDKELFAQAIEAVNEAADRAEKAGQAATEAAGQAAEDAQQTAEDRKEVAKMVETVSDISEQVKKVEELSNKVQEAATKTGQDAQQTAEDRVEVGKMLETVRDVSEQVKSVEESVRKAKESEQAAAGHRTAVEEMKNSVEQTASTFPQKVQEGVQAIENAGASEVQEITQAGTAQKTAVEAAGTQAVESVENVQQVATEAVETAKTEAVQAVQAEGAKQIKEVQDKGAEVLQSIPEDFTTQMETKLDKQQGIENKGKALVIGEDGNVVPGEVASGGGDGIAIINTMSGESPLVIPDSAERVNKRLELGGKTEQVQTTGKNLFDEKLLLDFDSENYDKTQSGSGFYYYKFPVNGTVTASTKNANKNGEYLTVGIKPDGSDKTWLSHGSAAISKYKTLTPEDGNIYLGVNNSLERVKSMIQNTGGIIINEGSAAKPYEPYTGGKPSPSPEYPQEIKNSGKWNEEKQKYEVDVKITGKNLFDMNKFIDTCNFTKNEDGTFRIDKYVERYDCFIPANTILSIEVLKVEDSSGAAALELFYEDGKSMYIGFGQVGVKTFLIQKDVAYIKVLAYRKHEYKYIQLEKGRTATPYEPYKEQTLTLTSDRPITKWDRLVEQGGQIGWLYNSVNETIDGKTGKWSIQPASKIFYRTDITFPIVVPFCIELLGYDYSMGGYKKDTGITINNLGILCITLPEEVELTLDAYKQYLADNPLHVLYKGDSEEFVPLPQSEQNAIRALKTYYPTTVITVDGGGLDPDIKVTYTADTKNYIDGKVSAKVASILRQYQADTANLLSLMPMETQATMIENDTNNILNNLESEEAHE